jgi:diacylglycerol kinase family enzyme
MYERIVVVTNPNSTRAGAVGRDVIRRLADERIPFTHISTRYPSADDNIADLTGKIHDGDKLISAGGDGTMLAVSNAALDSGAEGITVAPLAFGNFNDMAGKQTDPLAPIAPNAHRVSHTPLGIEVNGELWRYSPAYFTLGFTALAAATFEDQNSRERLHAMPRAFAMAANVAQLGEAYFMHRNELLPAFHTSQSPIVQRAVTDVLILNHSRAGRIIRSHTDYGQTAEFGYVERDVRRILPNLPFGFAALAGKAPAKHLTDETLSFSVPSSVPVQTDGEYARLNDVTNIRVYKDTSRPLTLLRPNKE